MKAVTGGRTPCILDPVLVPLGLDRFWDASEDKKLPSGTTKTRTGVSRQSSTDCVASGTPAGKKARLPNETQATGEPHQVR